MPFTRRDLLRCVPAGILGVGLAVPVLKALGWNRYDNCPWEHAWRRKVFVRWLVELEARVYREQILYYDGQWEYMDLELVDNPAGVLIGDLKDSEYLLIDRGLRALEPAIGASGKTCSIGFCPGNSRWYGWSHRAITGFRGGDRIFEASYGGDDTPVGQHGRTPIKTFEDAKLAASNFALFVS